MGYYTSFNMTLHNATEDTYCAIIDRLRQEDLIEYVFDEDLNSCAVATWYECEEDMKRISKDFPDVLFEINGIGEDNEDMWNLWVKNGKSQKCDCIITYPPYDESKLE